MKQQGCFFQSTLAGRFAVSTLPQMKRSALSSSRSKPDKAAAAPVAGTTFPEPTPLPLAMRGRFTRQARFEQPWSPRGRGAKPRCAFVMCAAVPSRSRVPPQAAAGPKTLWDAVCPMRAQMQPVSPLRCFGIACWQSSQALREDRSFPGCSRPHPANEASFE